MNTKNLVTEYTQLRDDIAARGPSDTLIVTCLNKIRRLHNLQARYERYQAKHGIYIECLECERKLTKRDLHNLKEAKAVNKEITEVLRRWRNGYTAGVAS